MTPEFDQNRLREAMDKWLPTVSYLKEYDELPDMPEDVEDDD